MDYEDPVITKRTFEECLRAQQRLRKEILILIKEDRCLSDDKERDWFFSELAHATFGLGSDKPFKIHHDDEVFFLGSIESAGRFIAHQTSNPVSIKRDGQRDSKPIQIAKLWEKLLFSLYEVFPVALDRSSAMSKEFDSTLRGDSYDFDPSK